MSFSYTFKDGAAVEVPELSLSSKEMRKLRSKSEVDIAYDLLEEHLSSDELSAIESYSVSVEGGEPVEKDRDFTEVMGFFNKWFATAISGK